MCIRGTEHSDIVSSTLLSRFVFATSNIKWKAYLSTETYCLAIGLSLHSGRKPAITEYTISNASSASSIVIVHGGATISRLNNSPASRKTIPLSQSIFLNLSMLFGLGDLICQTTPVT